MSNAESRALKAAARRDAAHVDYDRAAKAATTARDRTRRAKARFKAAKKELKDARKSSREAKEVAATAKKALEKAAHKADLRPTGKDSAAAGRETPAKAKPERQSKSDRRVVKRAVPKKRATRAAPNGARRPLSSSSSPEPESFDLGPGDLRT